MRPLITHIDTARNGFISNLRGTRDPEDSFSAKPKLSGRKKTTPRTLSTKDTDTSLSINLRRNYILAALPDEEYTRLAPHLELVELPRGHLSAYFLADGDTSARAIAFLNRYLRPTTTAGSSG